MAGPAPGIHELGCRDYFFGIIESEIMPLVEAISWHPGPYSLEYDDLREYSSEYPSILQNIKDAASFHGFKGEYIVEELLWRTQEAIYHPWTFSETVVAKYFARGIIMHLGMNITTGMAGISHEMDIPKMIVIRNLCTIMAGTKPIKMPIEIQSKATNIRSYSFSLPDGDKLLALWTEGIASDDDSGINGTITLHGVTSLKVIAMDVLNSFEQELIASVEDGSLVIRDFLIKDYPIILRLSP